MTTGPTTPGARPMTGPHAVAVWLVAASGFLAIILAQLLNPADLAFVLVLEAVIGPFSVVGALLVTRLRRNPIGWILLAGGTLIAWAVAGVSYATLSGDTCGCLPGTVPIALAANVLIVPVIGGIGVFVPLLFPDGHLPSPRWRLVAWFAIVAIGLLTVVVALTPGEMSSGAMVPNPIGIDGFDGTDGAFGLLAYGPLIVALGLAFASVVWRFRHSRDVERQQLRWFGGAAFMMVALVSLGASPIGPMPDAGWIVMLAGLALLPIGTGVAILRYRLYDLDRLVSRTIAYGLVTGALLVVYLAVNLALTTLLSSIATTDSLAVAASTLVVAALFTPIRQRVKQVVDRRFDRARYDAEGMTIAFSDRLRNEVDIAAVSRDLDTTIRTAIAPTTLTLWIRETRP